MKKLIAITLGIALAGVGTVAIAARNSTGTYTLPPGAVPVVSGQTITSNLWNNTFNDLATEMTASLSRDGKGSMRAPLYSTDGSVSLPGLSFDTLKNAGLYKVALNDVAMAVNGAKVQEWTTAGTTVTGNTTTGTLNVTTTATVPAPVNDTDAATKLYVVNSLTPADGTATITAGTGWTVSVSTDLKRYAGKLVVLNFVATLTSGASTTMATLPAGFIPASSSLLFTGYDSTGGVNVICQVNPLTGTVVLFAPPPTVGHIYWCNATFRAA